jgi:FkbM family methyltransferase
MRTLVSMSRGVFRRLTSWPLQLVGENLRAEALEGLSEKMVVSTPVPGGRVRFYAPSTLLRSRASSMFSKEPETIQWIDGFEDGVVLWDIGANVGVYALYAAIRRKASVLAFEPSAPNFHVLSRNIHLNSLTERVTAYCIALTRETGLGVLNLDSLSMGSAINQFGNPGETSPYSVKRTAAILHGTIGFSIDDFIAKFAPPFPNHIKMDVDGIELSILEGATRTLRDSRLISVLVELSVTDNEQQRRAVSFLEDAGLALLTRGEVQGTEQEKAANFIFHRTEHRRSSARVKSKLSA